MSELGKCHPTCAHRLVQAAWVSSAASFCLCRVRVALHQTPQVGAQTPSSPRPSVSCYGVRLRHPGRYPRGRDGLRGNHNGIPRGCQTEIGKLSTRRLAASSSTVASTQTSTSTILNLWGLVNFSCVICADSCWLIKEEFLKHCESFTILPGIWKFWEDNERKLREVEALAFALSIKII